MTRLQHTSKMVRANAYRVIIAVACATTFLRHRDAVTEERLHAIMNALAGASGTMLGFLITALSIIAALMDRTLIANLKKTGHFDVLVGDSLVACASLMLCLAMSLVALFMSGDHLRWVAAAAFFFIVFGFLCLCQVGIRFRNILSVL